MATLVAIQIGPSLEAVHRLRDQMHDLLPRRDWSDGVILVASELVTNALVHGAGPVDVRIETRSGVIHLEVDDTCRVMGTPSSDSRGIRIIEGIASAWGVRSTAAGKTVWAEVATDQP